MKTAFVLLTVLITFSCAKTVDKVSDQKPSPSPLPSIAQWPASPTPVIPKDGEYNGKGVITKLNVEQASVEIDHEEIPDVMPPMRMEFFVSDKKMLDGLKEGDRVDFVLRYKHPTETIINITKIK